MSYKSNGVNFLPNYSSRNIPTVCKVETIEYFESVKEELRKKHRRNLIFYYLFNCDLYLWPGFLRVSFSTHSFAMT